MTDHLAALLREAAPVVLARIARRYPEFALCEDAVQEALLAAATGWPEQGLPDNPTGWLVTVAGRRWIELQRNDSARRRRELAVTDDLPAGTPSDTDDSLALLVLCAHPALPPAGQVALMLRAVGGLTTAEIARALLVPESTVGQRISRAKARIRESGGRFRSPSPDQLRERLPVVRSVLYLIFTEGHTASAGPRLQRVDLAAEAIRLTRMLHAAAPDDDETTGLLALLLLTDARRAARSDAAGRLVPLAEQDRSRWNAGQIDEGSRLLTATLPAAAVGPYLLQAAIAAVHDQAVTAEVTDWPQILGLYDILLTHLPGPMVTLNRIVAVAMVHGPQAGLVALDQAAGILGDHPRVPAVRAHLLELNGDLDAARSGYLAAAATTLNLVEREHLLARAAAVNR
jgi:RNA polymerase sigma factor (sigma-70 family)